MILPKFVIFTVPKVIILISHKNHARVKSGFIPTFRPSHYAFNLVLSHRCDVLFVLAATGGVHSAVDDVHEGCCNVSQDRQGGSQSSRSCRTAQSVRARAVADARSGELALSLTRVWFICRPSSISDTTKTNVLVVAMP